MSYNGNEGDFITLSEGAALTSAFRRANPAGSVISQYVGGVKISALLAQTGAVGIRVYYGLDTKGAPKLVAVAVDSNGNDILTAGSPMILDKFMPCPASCPPTSNSLNS